MPSREDFSSFSDADVEIARKRYMVYTKLRKEDPDAPFQELLARLPKEGATLLACGHSRFDHVEAGIGGGAPCRHKAKGRKK